MLQPASRLARLSRFAVRRAAANAPPSATQSALLNSSAMASRAHSNCSGNGNGNGSGHAHVRVHSSRLPDSGPGLSDFIRESRSGEDGDHVAGSAALHEESEMNFPATGAIRSLEELEDEQLQHESENNAQRKFFIETYGCQMNSADSEIVRAILLEHRYTPALSQEDADIILLNTCAVRDNAEAKIWNRLEQIRQVKAKLLRTQSKKAPKQLPTVGVLGCMAERLKTQLLESDKMVDLVVGPDAYRDIPNLLRVVRGGSSAVNVQLSLDETYADIAPVRSDPESPSAFVSIMRGCNNMCSYCIVPFTRGRERSRVMNSIVGEVRTLRDQGVKEVVLLGQNVNSFHDKKSEGASENGRGYVAAEGFANMFRARDTLGFRFVDLLDEVSRVDPEIRIRFTSPHPKDFPDEVFELMNERFNICSSIHMPAQSGSSSMLARMRRGYTREAYIALVDNMRARIPGVAISSDFIAGFCGETEQEHEDTLSLMRHVCYDQAFMFAYSVRARTHAAHRMEDDVPSDVKLRRLQQVIGTYSDVITRKNKVEDSDRLHLVLVQGASRRSSDEKPMLTGLTDTHKRCVFADHMLPGTLRDFQHQAGSLASQFLPLPPLAAEGVRATKGDYVLVRVHEAGRHTLHATPIARTTLQEAAQLVPREELGARVHSLEALGL
ncbi:Cdk5 regulatory subunit-associated protein 1 [Globisporangium polare]